MNNNRIEKSPDLNFALSIGYNDPAQQIFTNVNTNYYEHIT